MDVQAVEDFAHTVGTDQARSTASALAYIGDRLGLWAALAGSGPVTSGELADLTGLDERYLGEWLATETAAGYLTYDPDTGAFTLPAEHAAVLADDSSPSALAGAFESVAAFWAVAGRVAEAFHTGEGVAWEEQDPRLFSGVDRFFTPLYRRSLITEWLPALEGTVAKLEHGGRVLDVGCGHGTSAILMAQAFPRSTFGGIDAHEGSVAAARAAAVKAGVADRVTFSTGSAVDDLGSGWDLIAYFDAFHHVGDPVAAARRARESLAADGTLMLVEPQAGDRLEDNLGLMGLFYYGASTLVCIPDALAQDGGEALGGQAGPGRLSEVLAEAGFSRVREAVETPFNLVIEARP
ncbi:MAG: methyltransferase [Actinomycetota bacterium]|nr:methyltransferase [Actinomycetota bacterium]